MHGIDVRWFNQLTSNSYGCCWSVDPDQLTSWSIGTCVYRNGSFSRSLRSEIWIAVCKSIDLRVARAEIEISIILFVGFVPQDRRGYDLCGSGLPTRCYQVSIWYHVCVCQTFRQGSIQSRLRIPSCIFCTSLHRSVASIYNYRHRWPWSWFHFVGSWCFLMCGCSCREHNFARMVRWPLGEGLFLDCFSPHGF